MSTIDEILATGRYTDRRGRIYRFDTKHLTWMGPQFIRGKPFGLEPLRIHEMRLLIERDMHRDECVGLHDCYVHPSTRVILHDGKWSVIAPGLQVWKDTRHRTFPEAMDAARALAVES